MTQALLSELARVKAIFQLRAITLHMGVNPDSGPCTPHVHAAGTAAVSSQTSGSGPEISTPNAKLIPDIGGFAAARGTTASNLVSPDPVRKTAHTDRTEGVTHRDLSQHADQCVSNRNVIVPVHSEVL